MVDGSTPSNAEKAYKRQQASATWLLSPGEKIPARMERGQDLRVIAWSPGWLIPADQQPGGFWRLQRQSQTSSGPALVCPGGPLDSCQDFSERVERRRIPCSPPGHRRRAYAPLGFQLLQQRLLAPVAIASRPPRSSAKPKTDAWPCSCGREHGAGGTEMRYGDHPARPKTPQRPDRLYRLIHFSLAEHWLSPAGPEIRGRDLGVSPESSKTE